MTETSVNLALSTHAPAKCGACDRPVDSPLVCSNCHTLLPSEECTHFALLGVEAVFDLDAARLRRSYLENARLIHPDQFAGDTGSSAAESQRISARLNAAYATLSDPLRRAEYLLELHGGSSAADDKRVPAEVLAAALEYNERIADAAASRDRETLADCRRALREELETRSVAIAEEARRLPGDEAHRARLRSDLNAAKYYRRIMEQLSDS